MTNFIYGLSLGLAIGGLIFIAYPKHITEIQPVEYQFIEYIVDICSSDNIGLKRLTVSDVDELIR